MIWATLPVNTMLELPLPVTATPPASVAVMLPLPLGTLKVTVTLAAAASTSLICKPLKRTLMSSLVVKLAGSALTGASLTAVTAMLTVPVAVPPLPSCTM